MRAAVVGAGAIGAALEAPGQVYPLTHAGGYQAAGCDLVALVDTAEKVNQEAARWGTAAYRDFELMLAECQPELISFAVPASVRRELMLKALACDSVRVVIAEKPLAATLQEARTMITAYQQRGVPIIVNYTRRFVPIWQELAGRPAMSATIKYAKGVAHNGTHAIDLCRMLFGECLSARALSQKHDFWPDDPTVTAHLTFERCPDVLLQAMDERCFTLFEVDIVGSNWRVIVDQDGRRVRWFGLQNSVGIPAGKRLVPVDECDSGGGAAMLRLIQHALAVAEGASVACTGEDALAALEIAQQLSKEGAA